MFNLNIIAPKTIEIIKGDKKVTAQLWNDVDGNEVDTDYEFTPGDISITVTSKPEHTTISWDMDDYWVKSNGLVFTTAQIKQLISMGVKVLIK